MSISRIRLIIITMFLMLTIPRGYCQSTEERFHDLFVTAGYATAFGAALGAAALSFKSRPENHLRFIAVGASLGFFSGSVLGTYITFSPVFTERRTNQLDLMLAENSGKTFMALVPTYNINTHAVESFAARATLLTF